MENLRSVESFKLAITFLEPSERHVEGVQWPTSEVPSDFGSLWVDDCAPLPFRCTREMARRGRSVESERETEFVDRG